VAELVLPGVANEKAGEIDVPGPEARPIVGRLEPPDRDCHALSALATRTLAAHQRAKRLDRLARPGGQLGRLGEGDLRQFQARRDDEIRRQLAQGLEVMQQGLLNQRALLHPVCERIPFELLLRR
jgi:hypothetical protein